MIDFDAFKTRWLGGRCDWDKVHKFQCVDLVLQGIYEMDGIGTGVRGNAIDYWNHTSAPLLKIREKIPPGVPREGDIAVFKTRGYNGDPARDTGDGHIGWATGQFNSTQMEILEQNGQTGGGSGEGLDAIRLRWIDRSRLAGLLRPIPAIPYSIAPIPDRNLRINKQTHMYNLGLRDFPAIQANPVGTPNIGYTFVAKAVLLHQSGNRYFLPDPNNPVGFHVADCDDYDPTPKVQTPPAAPVPIPRITTYELVETVMTFKTAKDAKSRINPVTTTGKGQYVLLKEDEQARELVKKNMDRESFWINDYDNKVEEPKPEPVPEPTIPDREPEVEPITIPDHQPERPVVPTTYELFDGGVSIKLKSRNSMPIDVKALDGDKPTKMTLGAYRELPISHYFEIPDRFGNIIRYYQDESLHYYNRFYALRADWFPDPYKVAEALNKAEERVYSRFDSNRDGSITISDFIQTPVKIGGQLYTSGKAVINTALKSPQVKRFIDGIRSRK